MSLGRLQLFGINLFRLSVSQQPPDFLLFLKGLSPCMKYSSHVSANNLHIGIGPQWRSSERMPRRWAEGKRHWPCGGQHLCDRRRGSVLSEKRKAGEGRRV